MKYKTILTILSTLLLILIVPDVLSVCCSESTQCNPGGACDSNGDWVQGCKNQFGKTRAPGDTLGECTVCHCTSPTECKWVIEDSICPTGTKCNVYQQAKSIDPKYSLPYYAQSTCEDPDVIGGYLCRDNLCPTFNTETMFGFSGPGNAINFGEDISQVEPGIYEPTPTSLSILVSGDSTTYSGCCGDDSSEHIIIAQDGSRVCCKSATSCVDLQTAECRDGKEESDTNKNCNDGIDNDCDGGADYRDSSGLCCTFNNPLDTAVAKSQSQTCCGAQSWDSSNQFRCCQDYYEGYLDSNKMCVLDSSTHKWVLPKHAMIVSNSGNYDVLQVGTTRYSCDSRPDLPGIDLRLKLLTTGLQISNLKTTSIQANNPSQPSHEVICYSKSVSSEIHETLAECHGNEQPHSSNEYGGEHYAYGESITDSQGNIRYCCSDNAWHDDPTDQECPGIEEKEENNNCWNQKDDDHDGFHDIDDPEGLCCTVSPSNSEYQGQNNQYCCEKQQGTWRDEGRSLEKCCSSRFEGFMAAEFPNIMKCINTPTGYEWVTQTSGMIVSMSPGYDTLMGGFATESCDANGDGTPPASEAVQGYFRSFSNLQSSVYQNHDYICYAKDTTSEVFAECYGDEQPISSPIYGGERYKTGESITDKDTNMRYCCADNRWHLDPSEPGCQPIPSCEPSENPDYCYDGIDNDCDDVYDFAQTPFTNNQISTSSIPFRPDNEYDPDCTVNIKGRVIDGTHLGQDEAEVVISGKLNEPYSGKNPTFTYSQLINENGEFNIIVNADSIYDLTITAVGFETKVIPIATEFSDLDLGDIPLGPEHDFCQSDCTNIANNLCNANCDKYYGNTPHDQCEFGGSNEQNIRKIMKLCNERAKGHEINLGDVNNPNLVVRCCEGQPFTKKEVKAVVTTSAKDLLRTTKLVMINGREVKMLIDVIN